MTSKPLGTIRASRTPGKDRMNRAAKTNPTPQPMTSIAQPARVVKTSLRNALAETGLDEVQIDFDEKTKKSTRVGVSTNMWETDATERAKGDKK